MGFVASDEFSVILWGVIALLFLIKAFISSDGRSLAMAVMALGVALTTLGLEGAELWFFLSVLVYLFGERRERK